MHTPLPLLPLLLLSPFPTPHPPNVLSYATKVRKRVRSIHSVEERKKKPLYKITLEEKRTAKTLLNFLLFLCQVSAECNQLFQRQYTVEDPLDRQDNPALFSLRLVQEEVQQQKHFQ